MTRDPARDALDALTLVGGQVALLSSDLLLGREKFPFSFGGTDPR